MRHPKTIRPVRELLAEAGQNVDEWATNLDGSANPNPNNNRHRNSKWAFLGLPGEPVVVCLWFTPDNGNFHPDADPPYYIGNERAYQATFDLGPVSSRKLMAQYNVWIKSSQELDLTIQRAKGRPVRVLLVDGTNSDEAATGRGSEVERRELDPGIWWVHSYDADTGEYRLVRGQEPAPEVEPVAPAIPDVADDPEFLRVLASIPVTERDAVIKARIGQGPYRDALYERWGGCAVSDVTMKELLTASHIRPWRHCKETPADRVNVANGLLLVPTLDRLFDRGLITFEDDFTIRFSSRLHPREIRYLKLDANIRLRLRDFEDIRPYLDWHRKHVFQP